MSQIIGAFNALGIYCRTNGKKLTGSQILNYEEKENLKIFFFNISDYVEEGSRLRISESNVGRTIPVPTVDLHNAVITKTAKGVISTEEAMVRYLESSDADQVKELDSISSYDMYEYLEDQDSDFESDNLLGIFLHGNLIGYLDMYQDRWSNNATLYQMYIKPEYRRLHLGTMLYKESLEDSIVSMSSLYYPETTEGRAFFQSVGLPVVRKEVV